MNIVIGPKEERKLISGYFTVANIFCSKCNEEMGWIYIRAFEATQRYKEGKCILEKAKLMKEY
ncbi:protein yippee-like-like [Dorcoceras hygrometricum]|uniref:Protein yippee-like n=1 Tax=Dorcoceras hygrometricum TaxID=472368 RepID=A0A2Z7BUX0_9LAMI|nr:protein yippee-like-like [Dorcoceras hygrometricum]